jgi:hypothetical protein
MDRCRWCGRKIAERAPTGRRREFCKRSCRQRDYEARRRADELGLSESELVVARRELDELYDRLYVLECAVEDVERDTAGQPTKHDLASALAWLLEAAKPLAGRRIGD